MNPGSTSTYYLHLQQRFLFKKGMNISPRVKSSLQKKHLPPEAPNLRSNENRHTTRHISSCLASFTAAPTVAISPKLAMSAVQSPEHRAPLFTAAPQALAAKERYEASSCQRRGARAPHPLAEVPGEKTRIFPVVTWIPPSKPTRKK